MDNNNEFIDEIKNLNNIIASIRNDLGVSMEQHRASSKEVQKYEAFITVVKHVIENNESPETKIWLIRNIFLML